MKYNQFKSQVKIMIPKLLISNNHGEIQKYIKAQIKKFAISPFDILTLGENGNPIKIEQIRDLKQKLGLKPGGGTKKATIIYAAQNLTAEAQNALLKTLEEPPEDTVILLCTPNENLLLPTIVSRCEIVRLNSKHVDVIPAPQRSAGSTPAGILNQGIKIPDQQLQNNMVVRNDNDSIRENPLCKILQFDVGEKFALAEKLTAKVDKDEKLEDVRKRVEEWLAEMISEIQNDLRRDKSRLVPTIINNLKTLLAAQKQLRQNLNLRLVLENCFMNLI